MSLVISDEQPLFKMADFAYTKRKIEEEEDIQKAEQSKTSIASRVQKYMAANRIDDYLEVFNALVSFLMYTIFAI